MMRRKPSLVSLHLALALGLSIPAACMGPADKGDKPAVGKTKPDPVFDDKKDRKKAAKAGDTKKKDAKQAPKKDKVDPRFKKDRPIPKGLTNDEVYAWNKFMGDPIDGPFTLEMALAGDDKLANTDGGKLKATFDTTMGTFDCTLFEDKTPLTVANFVGLARGTRPTYDKKKNEWAKVKFYDGAQFFRVVKNFMLQTGDKTNSGKGNPGFTVVDELDSSLKHNKAGILSMANRGPNTGSSQFFVTVKATPHLDGKHTVFGQCKPKVAVKISKVKVQPQYNHRPVEPVTINKLKISRGK